ncbi:hypothetical protein GSI_03695 [Ganoderma sinense ZZ0214-1]|uniref:Reverse transcriptase/retrotransposon-derived protein RNase H-like domain-containing protein n=1 Tax=Ganoderma sinense ZZ0214-1 TaxID=1077348 RepID=A0A2G8SJS4_9APHY|nr:hypothetical protein GSI_03695 [Ganoderma sinense ZZ0214-1]
MAHAATTGPPAMPVQGDRTCPVFDERDPRSLNRYFSDLEALFRKHSVSDDTTPAAQEERKKLAVRYLSWNIEASWSSLEEFDKPMKDYAAFKTAVFELYPGVSSAPEWTIEDFQDIIDKRVAAGPVKDINEYSQFYVEVRPVVKYLLRQNRINNIEANKSLAHALGEVNRLAVKSRLETDVPIRTKNTPYTFEQFHKAATYVLQHRNDDFDEIWDDKGPVGSTSTPSRTVPAPTPSRVIESLLKVKQEEASAFANIISKQVRAGQMYYPDRSTARTPPPNASNTYRRDLPPRPPTLRKGCYYCGADGCETKRCPEAAADIADRKIKRENGLLVMYDGSPIPYHLGPGTLREKVNFYLDAKCSNEAPVEHMFLEFYLSADDHGYVLVDQDTAPTLSTEDGEALEALSLQINELQVGEKRKTNLRFDGVEIIQRPRPFSGKRTVPQRAPTPPPTRASVARPPMGTATAPRPPTPGPAKGKETARSAGAREAAPTTMPLALSSARPVEAVPLHPYAKAKDATDSSKLPVRPVEPLRGMSGVQQPPAYRLKSKAINPETAEELKERVYDTEVTMTVRELLSSSSDAVPDEDDPCEEADSDNGASDYANEAAEGFAVKVSESSESIVAARDRNQIRTLWCKVNDTAEVECVLDGGSQIVAISEHCCNRLRIPVDTSADLPIQSANGAVNKTIGIARNIPVQLPGDIIVYLQMYVVKTTAYEVLLGRPFETLVQAKVENVGDSEQLITIKCPNSGATVRVATSARGERKKTPSAEELLDDVEAAALVVEYDHRSGEATIAAYTPLDEVSSSSVTLAYLSACDEGVIPEGDLHDLSSSIPLDSFLFAQTREFLVSSSQLSPAFSGFISLPEHLEYKPIFDISASPTNTPPVESFAAAKKKYKPVARKVRPLLSELPEKFRIVRNIVGDSLADLPPLNPNPPKEFLPGTRYTAERHEELRARHAKFLWPVELDLLDDMVKNQEMVFAWTDMERGKFKPEFFPPVEMPTVEHKPWVLKNILIPPGIYCEVCEQIKRKIATGVYEPSNSAYKSRWFTVAKKDGKPRIVHSLEPLNAVTIQHSGIPPVPEHLVECFTGRACIGVLDLYVGYNERELAESSRDLTMFQTPFGAHRLTTLPMGWTNSVPIFHDDVTYILQEEIPDFTVPYVDDVPLRGPESDYHREDGTYETIPENPGIRCFVWEHFLNVNRILNRMRYAGGTFSGPKAVIIDDDLIIIGHRCTSVGRLPDDERVRVVKNWTKFETLSDIRAFLGTVGVARIFIRNFAKRANALVHLTRKDVPFEFGEAQWKAVEDLQNAVLESPALRPLDYNSDALVILGVDTSAIAVGYMLCQQDLGNPKIRYYNRFGSITLNERESRFSQPKLELYGLFRTLRALKF